MKFSSKKNVYLSSLIVGISIFFPKMVFATVPVPGELVNMTLDAGDAGMKFMNLFNSIHGLGVVTILIGIVISGIMYVFGQSKHILNVIIATIIMFGLPYIIALISNSFQ